MIDEVVHLKKGHYLAPKVSTRDFDALLVGTTKYTTPMKTGRWHAHERPMISFVLYGQNVEERNGQTLIRSTGANEHILKAID